MTECPVCLGEGKHDFTDSDALMAEQLTDAQLAMTNWPLGVQECEECEGTGFVSEERAKDLRAAATATVDQWLEGRRRGCGGRGWVGGFL